MKFCVAEVAQTILQIRFFGAKCARNGRCCTKGVFVRRAVACYMQKPCFGKGSPNTFFLIVFWSTWGHFCPFSISKEKPRRDDLRDSCVGRHKPAGGHFGHVRKSEQPFVFCRFHNKRYGELPNAARRPAGVVL